MLGLAAGTARVARPATAAIDRVKGACYVIAGPPLELEQVPVQGAHRAPTP